MGWPALQDKRDVIETGFQLRPITQDEAQGCGVAFGSEAVFVGSADDDPVVFGFEVEYALDVFRGHEVFSLELWVAKLAAINILRSYVLVNILAIYYWGD